MRRMTSPGGSRRFWAPVALIAGYALLVACWLGANPPGAAADEPEHYVRALSVGMGVWIGSPARTVRAFPEDPERAPFMYVISRDVPVPRGLGAPASWSCFINDHVSSGACLVRDTASADSRQTTYQGSYPPVYYILPGVAMRSAREPLAALLVGRAVTAIIGLGFLAIAVLALWDQAAGAISLAGVSLAISPMVLSVAGSLSTSGAEIPAGVATVAIILRLGRQDRVSAWMKWALVAALAVLAAVRPFGPAYVLFALVLGALHLGPGALREAISRSLAARVGLAVVVLATLATVAWDQVFLVQRLPSPAAVPGLLGLGLLYVSEAAREMIGVFGQTDTLMPGWAYGLWGLTSVGLIAFALQVGTHRQRRVLEATLLGVVLVGVVLALVELPTGFGVNGRQVLPVAVAIPMLAGETCYLRRSRLSAGRYRALSITVLVTIPVVQLAGWYANAHRVAVGTAGPWWFVARPQWAPPGGWLSWQLLALVGTSCLVASLVARNGRPGGPAR